LNICIAAQILCNKSYSFKKLNIEQNNQPERIEGEDGWELDAAGEAALSAE
jgi:hypothetical protein